MGVQGLWQILQPTGRPVSLHSLDGKVLAVDVSIWLHQAVKGMRDKDGSPLPNAHLHVLFSRVCKLLYYRIKPVFVFDGGVPTLKKQTMAARRERKEFAEVESDKASKKLIDNLMKSHAIKEVLGENQPGTSGAWKPRGAPGASGTKSDLFELPPLPETFQSVEDDDIQNPWNVQDSQRQIIQEQYQDVSNVDIDSEDFRCLPAEIQHEILTELKERGKRLSRLNYVMPEDSIEFSGFQINKILKQSNLSNRLDKVVKVMNSGNSSALTGGLDEDFFSADIQTRKVMSDESSHIILIKGLSGKKRQEELAKIEEESTTLVDGHDDCCIVGESESGDVKKKSLADSEDKLLIDSDSDIEEGNDEKEVTNSKHKARGNIIDITEEKGSSSDEEIVISKKRSRILDDNDDNVEVDGDHRLKSMEKNEPGNVDFTTGTNTYNSMEKTDVIEVDSESGSTRRRGSVIEVDERSNSPCLVINEDSYDSVSKQKPEEVISTKGQRSDEGSPPTKVRRYDIDTENVKKKTNDSSREVIHIDDSSDVNKTAESVDSAAGKDSEDEGFVEVTINPESIKADELFPAEMFVTNGEDLSGRQRSADTKSTPLEGTEEDAEEVTANTDSSEKAESLMNQYQAITEEELEDYHEQLEAETQVLQEERGKQERLAASINDQMYAEAQELLRLFGVPYIISPMEAEAQCAQLDVLDLTEGTITDDSDIWLFGGRKVYKNFFNQGQHVEMYTQNSIDSNLGLDRQIFINLALLCGSDYTEGIRGVGPVTAMEILSEFPGSDLEALVAFKSWWMDINKIKKHPPMSKLKTKLKQLDISEGFPNPAVVDAYLHPTVDHSDDPFSWAMPDLDLLRDFTGSKLGWSKMKTDELLLPVMKRLREKQSQTKINNYFQPENFMEPKKMTSTRLKKALQKMTDPESSETVQTSASPKDNDVQIVSVSRTRNDPKGGRGKRPMKRGGGVGGKGRRGRAPPAPVMQAEVNLSESSSSDEDDKILANLDYESWIDNSGDAGKGESKKGKMGKGGKGKNKSSLKGKKTERPPKGFLIASDSD